MPERSFGRTVRYRRTKLGLSQAKLGELVGRSAATIRSWERDKSIPKEERVLHALSAILGVDERSLFEKAGQEPPSEHEMPPTLEQALASLGPGEDTPDAGTSDGELDTDDVDELDEPGPAQHWGDGLEEADEPDAPGFESETPASALESPVTQAGYVGPPEPYVITRPTPPFVEPSYIEDEGQRQIYRVRNLATLVVAVALVIALMWALSESLEALGSWWDGFFGGLRL